MQRKYFGTDGIRGRVGEPPITPDFMMKLGWSAGRVLGRGGHGRVLIGKDTRISGYMFESALESGLSAAGMDICLLGPLPTPAIAYLTCSTQATAGIVISASHNPFEDNGIKFFSADGMKLPDAIEMAIEEELDRPLAVVEPARLGKATRIDDAARRYIEFCKSTVGTGFNLDGLGVVVDCAHGATYHIAPILFSELGARVHAIGNQPDGLNINADFGATNPDNLCRTMQDTGANIGIAFDGDGDRVIMVDECGELLDGDELLYILAMDRPGDLNGAVVGTHMSNLGLEQAVRSLGLNFVRTTVGDRYILEAMLERNLVLGGETSGHLLCLNLTTTGDGIIAALQILDIMRRSGRSLHELKQGMHKYPQQLVNVRLQKPVDIMSLPQVRTAVRDAEAVLGGSGRILLRPSGTEPVIRIMVEGDDAGQVSRLSLELADSVRTAIGGN